MKFSEISKFWSYDSRGRFPEQKENGRFHLACRCDFRGSGAVALVPLDNLSNISPIACRVGFGSNHSIFHDAIG